MTSPNVGITNRVFPEPALPDALFALRDLLCDGLPDVWQFIENVVLIFFHRIEKSASPGGRVQTA